MLDARLALALLLTCSSCALQSERAEEHDDRPNILFIFSDDHAVNAIGAYGSRLAALDPTPHLDRLAAQGVRFENTFCTNSICVPSRASVLTGQYSHVNGVKHLADALPDDADILSESLQEAGYTTCLIGKWHLKSEPRGFDHWEVLRGQGSYRNPTLHGPDKHAAPVEHEGHSTDVITDRCLHWLDRRRMDRPFFLACHYKATHEAWQYAGRYASLYEDVEITEPATLFEDDAHRSEATRGRGYRIERLAKRMSRNGHVPERLDLADDVKPDERRRIAYRHFLRAYLRTVRGIDDNVGRLLEWLRDHDLDDETVVIYSSDQGYFLGEHDYIDKRWMFEESLRMPLIVRFPPTIPAGSVRTEMILNTDFAPLFLDYANLPPVPTHQGRSFRQLARGEDVKDWRTDFYYRYWTHEPERPAHLGLRTERYKLMHFYGNARPNAPAEASWELYDLEADPLEQRNVLTQQPLVAERLAARLAELQFELGDVAPPTQKTSSR